MPAQTTGLRLTRRGRIVIVAAAVLGLLGLFWLGATRGARATEGHGKAAAASSRGLETVTVHGRDTLWGIAVRARPGVDPRVTVQRMIDLNSLDGGVVNPGQRLFLPPR